MRDWRTSLKLGAPAAGLMAAWLPLLIGPAGAGAEELRVVGMGRSLGWLVASETGEVQFRDCEGRLVAAADARVEPTTRRCAAPPSGVDVVGIARTVDPLRGVLLVEDGAGRVHGFYVGGEGSGTAALDGVAVGRQIRVTGPVPGRATRIAPP